VETAKEALGPALDRPDGLLQRAGASGLADSLDGREPVAAVKDRGVGSVETQGQVERTGRGGQPVGGVGGHRRLLAQVGLAVGVDGDVVGSDDIAVLGRLEGGELVELVAARRPGPLPSGVGQGIAKRGR
jgi:hypothetical protein